MWTELLGWTASAVLLATLMAQVLRQWRTRTATGISPWLFIGQIAASSGFVAYSLLQSNAVFALTNSLILASAIAGQCLYRRNRRAARGPQRS